MKAKSNPTVKQAVLQQFPFLPDTFRGNELVRLVKIATRRGAIHTDTALRKLRVLKAQGKLNYELAGPKEYSLYKKIAI
jgi:hypothetical protein